MKHKQNLQALLGNVKSGVSMHDSKLHTTACLAYNGSLDAAQELHKAVLGDQWDYALTSDSVDLFKTNPSGDIFYGEADNLARTWLIAILAVLTSECDNG